MRARPCGDWEVVVSARQSSEAGWKPVQTRWTLTGFKRTVNEAKSIANDDSHLHEIIFINNGLQKKEFTLEVDISCRIHLLFLPLSLPPSYPILPQVFRGNSFLCTPDQPRISSLLASVFWVLWFVNIYGMPQYTSLLCFLIVWNCFDWLALCFCRYSP